MPASPPRKCTYPGCPAPGVPTRCAAHKRAGVAPRPTAAQQGYGSAWRRDGPAFFARFPTCVLCGGRANVRDHHPHTRRELVAAGVPDPNAWRWLRPLCTPCHNKATANDPRTRGGFNRDRR